MHDITYWVYCFLETTPRMRAKTVPHHLTPASEGRYEIVPIIFKSHLLRLVFTSDGVRVVSGVVRALMTQ